MATRKTNCCHSDGQKPSISDSKSLKLSRILTENVFMMFTISFCALWALSSAQYPGNNPLLGDRDPRFYSRPGVDYNPPNPGDKEYRWVDKTTQKSLKRENSDGCGRISLQLSFWQTFLIEKLSIANRKSVKILWNVIKWLGKKSSVANSSSTTQKFSQTFFVEHARYDAFVLVLRAFFLWDLKRIKTKKMKEKRGITSWRS